MHLRYDVMSKQQTDTAKLGSAALSGEIVLYSHCIVILSIPSSPSSASSQDTPMEYMGFTTLVEDTFITFRLRFL